MDAQKLFSYLLKYDLLTQPRWWPRIVYTKTTVLAVAPSPFDDKSGSDEKSNGSRKFLENLKTF